LCRRDVFSQRDDRAHTGAEPLPNLLVPGELFRERSSIVF
jgi:hypothetical protein